MNSAEERGPWLMAPNNRTGRVEVFEEIRGREVLVGSLPGNPTEDQLREICRRLSAEGRGP